jgi:hypothetical protein
MIQDARSHEIKVSRRVYNSPSLVPILNQMALLYISLFVISGFRRNVDENCAFQGYYAASSGNLVPTFRVNLAAQSSGAKNPK